MTIQELIELLQTFDPTLKVGWKYDCRWQEIDKSDIQVIRGSGEWGEPEEDSVQLCFS